MAQRDAATAEQCDCQPIEHPWIPVTGRYLYHRNSFSRCFGDFLSAQAQNSVHSVSSAVTTCSATAWQWNIILAISQRIHQVLSKFSLRLCSSVYIGASGQKSDPAIRSGVIGPTYVPIWSISSLFISKLWMTRSGHCILRLLHMCRVR